MTAHRASSATVTSIYQPSTVMPKPRANRPRVGCLKPSEQQRGKMRHGLYDEVISEDEDATVT